jgi:hypothetical protein
VNWGGGYRKRWHQTVQKANIQIVIRALGEIEWVKPLPVELKAGQIP